MRGSKLISIAAGIATLAVIGGTSAQASEHTASNQRTGPSTTKILNDDGSATTTTKWGGKSKGGKLNKACASDETKYLEFRIRATGVTDGIIYGDYVRIRFVKKNGKIFYKKFTVLSSVNDNSWVASYKVPDGVKISTKQHRKSKAKAHTVPEAQSVSMVIRRYCMIYKVS